MHQAYIVKPLPVKKELRRGSTGIKLKYDTQYSIDFLGIAIINTWNITNRYECSNWTSTTNQTNYSIPYYINFKTTNQ